MHALYLASVWLHVLAAITWIGGMFFLVLVVVPWLRRGDRAAAGAFLMETGRRFSAVSWACFAILLATGALNLALRGVRPSDLASGDWLTSPFGRLVAIKLAAFAAVLLVSAWHDFGAGPRAAAAIERDPSSPEAHAARAAASRMGRLNVLLALLLVALGVMLVRGAP